jgi:hypothetical protein
VRRFFPKGWDTVQYEPLYMHEKDVRRFFLRGWNAVEYGMYCKDIERV